MKQTRRVEVLYDDNTFYGFNLMNGGCYEHEQGIDGLKKNFCIYDIQSKTDGTYSNYFVYNKSYSNNYAPFYANKQARQNYNILKGKDSRIMHDVYATSIIDYDDYVYVDKKYTLKKAVMSAIIANSYYVCSNNGIKPYNNKTMQRLISNFGVFNACWNERAFMINSQICNKKYFYDLLFAMYDKDCLIFIYDDNLYVTIASRTPKSFIDKLVELDNFHEKLYTDAVKTGIYDFIELYSINPAVIEPIRYDDNGKVLFYFYQDYYTRSAIGNNVDNLYNVTAEYLEDVIKKNVVNNCVI